MHARAAAIIADGRVQSSGLAKLVALLNGLERLQSILTNRDGNSCILANDDAHCVLSRRARHLR